MCRSGQAPFKELASKYRIIIYSLLEITTVIKDKILLSKVEACSDDVESGYHDADGS